MFSRVGKDKETLIYNLKMILIYEDELAGGYFLSVNKGMNNLFSDNKCIYLFLNSAEWLLDKQTCVKFVFLLSSFIDLSHKQSPTLYN